MAIDCVEKNGTRNFRLTYYTHRQQRVDKALAHDFSKEAWLDKVT